MISDWLKSTKKANFSDRTCLILKLFVCQRWTVNSLTPLPCCFIQAACLDPAPSASHPLPPQVLALASERPVGPPPTCLETLQQAPAADSSPNRTMHSVPTKRPPLVVRTLKLIRSSVRLNSGSCCCITMNYFHNSPLAVRNVRVLSSPSFHVLQASEQTPTPVDCLGQPTPPPIPLGAPAPCLEALGSLLHSSQEQQSSST